MMQRSCLYRGSVMHRRLRPTMHRFRYRAFWLLLDLDELPALVSRLRLFSHNRFNLFALYDSDHGDGSATPLRAPDRTIARASRDRSGRRTDPSCSACRGHSATASIPSASISVTETRANSRPVVYQVHNTFGERHAYVAAVDERRR